MKTNPKGPIPRKRIRHSRAELALPMTTMTKMIKVVVMLAARLALVPASVVCLYVDVGGMALVTSGVVMMERAAVIVLSTVRAVKAEKIVILIVTMSVSALVMMLAMLTGHFLQSIGRVQPAIVMAMLVRVGTAARDSVLSIVLLATDLTTPMTMLLLTPVMILESPH